jgi:hypothetical protein
MLEKGPVAVAWQIEAYRMGLFRMRFTLNATMTLVALIAVVTWIVGVVGRARASAVREQCRSNLRNFALAVHGYQLHEGLFPPGTLSGGQLPPEQRVSWVPLILPFIDFYQGIHYLFESGVGPTVKRKR